MQYVFPAAAGCSQAVLYPQQFSNTAMFQHPGTSSYAASAWGHVVNTSADDGQKPSTSMMDEQDPAATTGYEMQPSQLPQSRQVGALIQVAALRALKRGPNSCCNRMQAIALAVLQVLETAGDPACLSQVLAAAKELHQQANLSVGLLPALMSSPDEAEARAFAGQVRCIYC